MINSLKNRINIFNNHETQDTHLPMKKKHDNVILLWYMMCNVFRGALHVQLKFE